MMYVRDMQKYVKKVKKTTKKMRGLIEQVRVIAEAAAGQSNRNADKIHAQGIRHNRTEAQIELIWQSLTKLEQDRKDSNLYAVYFSLREDIDKLAQHIGLNLEPNIPSGTAVGTHFGNTQAEALSRLEGRRK